MLAILVGIVLVVINVPTQRTRTKQGVAKANITKVCAAFTACLSSSVSGDTAGCDTWLEVGAIQPTEPRQTDGTPYGYTVGASGPSVTVDGCTISCSPAGVMSVSGAGCLVQ